MIYEFNHEDTLNDIKKNFSRIIDVSNSLADNTSDYRKFYNEIGLDFNIAKEAIKKSEYSLLIDCYTFSEKLLKNTIYHCLEFKNNRNDHVNNFILKKLKPDRFSPNPKFKFFEDELNSLNSEFKFVLNKSFSKIKTYDNMIQSRHQYAHSNIYPVDIRNSKNDLLEVLAYLAWECNMFLNNTQKHSELESLFKCIIDDSTKLKKINSEKKIRNLSTNERYKIDIVQFRINIKKFNKKYRQEINGLEIFRVILVEFENIEQLNFNMNSGSELSEICIKISDDLA